MDFFFEKFSRFKKSNDLREQFEKMIRFREKTETCLFFFEKLRRFKKRNIYINVFEKLNRFKNENNFDNNNK